MEIKKLVALTFLLSFVSTISSSSDESEALLLMSMMIKNQVSTQTQPITQRQEHLAKTLATLQKREQLEKKPSSSSVLHNHFFDKCVLVNCVFTDGSTYYAKHINKKLKEKPAIKRDQME